MVSDGGIIAWSVPSSSLSLLLKSIRPAGATRALIEKDLSASELGALTLPLVAPKTIVDSRYPEAGVVYTLVAVAGDAAEVAHRLWPAPPRRDELELVDSDRFG